jgi:hypothetical protein
VKLVAIICVAAAWALCGGAAAQSDNPMMRHYRAYQAAIEANDLAAAEREAAAALEASEARNGANTAVLALNLANARLELGRGQEALTPAQRAHELAQANGSPDPLLALLTLGRAELAANARGGRARLVQAIAEVERRGEFKDEGYEAAMALGRTALDSRDENEAEPAFAAAIRLAEGNDASRQMARAAAHLAHGMALLVLEDPGRPAPDIGERIARRRDGRADAAFAAAADTALPFAQQVATDGSLTSAQSVYANALVWEAVQRGRLMSLGWRLPDLPPRALLLDGDPSDGLPPCSFTVRKEPGPIYPNELLNQGYLASAVVVRAPTNAAGEVVAARTVARAGREEISEAVNRVAPRWTAIYELENGCSRAGVQLFAMMFYLEPVLD